MKIIEKSNTSNLIKNAKKRSCIHFKDANPKLKTSKSSSKENLLN
jgi:hypothetical protein